MAIPTGRSLQARSTTPSRRFLTRCRRIRRRARSRATLRKALPYTLPTDQTKSTIKSNTSKGGSGFNEIRFEDKKDSEEIFIQAQKDYNVTINNNETRKVGFVKKDKGDVTVDIYNNETRKVGFVKKDKGDVTVDIYNNRTVTLDQGNDKLEIKTGNREMLVDTGNDNETRKVGFVKKDKGDVTVDIYNNRTVTLTKP